MSPTTAASPLYRATGVEKVYGGAHALRGVGLDVYAGEVHALVGANGAGKSTLMKILGGIERPTAGTVAMDGTPVSFSSAADAQRAGIAMVSQELMIYPTLDVLHNLFVPSEPTRCGLVSRKRMRAEARDALAAVGLTVPTDRLAGELRLGDQQLLEIARALLRRPKILILDEPTSALNAVETTRLLDVVRELRSSGVTVLYVSHFLEDVLAVADVITVLRDGEVVATRIPREETDVSRVVRDMLGEAAHARLTDAVTELRERRLPRGGAARIELDEVRLDHRLDGVSLTASAGEVVGLAGLDGSGPTVVFDLLFGRLRGHSGTIRMHDGGSAPRTTTAGVRRGVAFVPADRRGLGLIAGKPVWENVGLARLTRARRGPLMVRPADLQRRALKRGAQMSLRMRSARMPVDQLSGGNQQKVVFAKWLEADPAVLLLDDPTRGVDVGARADMHAIIRDAAGSGRICLFHSSDLEEYVMVCDRVVVFHRGRVVTELTAPDIHHARLLVLVNQGQIVPTGAGA